MKKSMTRPLFVAALAAFVVAGCAHQRHFKVPNAERPQIVFANGYLIVNQEPIVVVRKPNEAATVSWRLAPDSGLAFGANDGIRILGRIKDEKMNPLPQRDDSQNGLFACGIGETAPASARIKDQTPKDQSVNQRAFTCAIPPNVTRGLYLYEINTTDASGARIRSDPTMMI